jgi:hypothetical protein
MDTHIKQFKIRASKSGELTRPRGLGETAKKYLRQWLYAENIGKPMVSISNKYLSKGLILEDQAIDAVSNQLGVFALKNEKYFENDFVCGTPDVITENEIWDTKCSYSHSTFPAYEEKVDHNYFYQAQCYMWLTGKEKFRLCYVLLSMPYHLAIKEANNYCRNQDIELTEEIENDFIDLYNYESIAIEDRIKIFKIDRDETKIELIKERVNESREYLNTLLC